MAEARLGRTIRSGKRQQPLTLVFRRECDFSQIGGRRLENPLHDGRHRRSQGRPSPGGRPDLPDQAETRVNARGFSVELSRRPEKVLVGLIEDRLREPRGRSSKSRSRGFGRYSQHRDLGPGRSLRPDARFRPDRGLGARGGIRGEAGGVAVDRRPGIISFSSAESSAA